MIAKIWNYSGWMSETNPTEIKDIFKQLLTKSCFSVLGFKEYFFKPFGYTCIWILGESHFAVHTFPEHNASYIELSSCNDEKTRNFIKMLPQYINIIPDMKLKKS